MEVIPCDRTIELIKQYLPEIGIELPIKDEYELGEISEFFGDMEVRLSSEYTEGGDVDRKFLDDICRANDDTEPCNIEDYIDLDKLNRRLMAL